MNKWMLLLCVVTHPFLLKAAESFEFQLTRPRDHLAKEHHFFEAHWDRQADEGFVDVAKARQIKTQFQDFKTDISKQKSLYRIVRGKTLVGLLGIVPSIKRPWALEIKLYAYALTLSREDHQAIKDAAFDKAIQDHEAKALVYADKRRDSFSSKSDDSGTGRRMSGSSSDDSVSMTRLPKIQ